MRLGSTAKVLADSKLSTTESQSVPGQHQALTNKMPKTLRASHWGRGGVVVREQHASLRMDFIKAAIKPLHGGTGKLRYLRTLERPCSVF